MSTTPTCTSPRRSSTQTTPTVLGPETIFTSHAIWEAPPAAPPGWSLGSGSRRGVRTLHFHQQGDLLGYEFVISRDVTERMEYVQAVQLSEARLRLTLEAARISFGDRSGRRDACGAAAGERHGGRCQQRRGRRDARRRSLPPSLSLSRTTPTTAYSLYKHATPHRVTGGRPHRAYVPDHLAGRGPSAGSLRADGPCGRHQTA